MSEVNFFEPKGPFYLNKLLENLKINKSSVKIYNIKTLSEASNKDITFFNSIDYKDSSPKTKAIACITSKKLEQFLPSSCIKIEVKNVLLNTALISKKFYPNAILIIPTKSLIEAKKLSSKFKTVTLARIFLLDKKRGK